MNHCSGSDFYAITNCNERVLVGHVACTLVGASKSIATFKPVSALAHGQHPQEKVSRGGGTTCSVGTRAGPGLVRSRATSI